ncbi:hypothetical protein ACFQVC_24815 [Streptomyces monticola]|uniref:DUF4410 domain-containing protein n=1 Tax=Streptomyces monticola TaxID=2666263 RepID=A0ABW2JNS3_9ACTN
MVVYSTDPEAKARIAAGGADAEFSALSSVALFAHEQADAEKVLAGVREAVGKCRKFGAQGSSYSGVRAQPDPKAGDESVAYRLTGSAEGQKGAMAFTVVRSGSTVAVFYSANLGGTAGIEVPRALVDAQIAELEKAAG